MAWRTVLVLLASLGGMSSGSGLAVASEMKREILVYREKILEEGPTDEEAFERGRIFSVEKRKLVSPSRLLNSVSGLTSAKHSERYSELKFESEEDLRDAIQALEAEGLEWEYSYPLYSTSGPQFSLDALDNLFPQQWSMFDSNQVNGGSQVATASIDALRAWSTSRGKGRIYVVDTGVSESAVEFEGVTLFQADFINEGGDHDRNGHGTHVASIAVGRQNLVGMIGVAPGESIEVVSVKVLNAQSQGSTAAAVAAMQAMHTDIQNYFSQNPDSFVVINMSLGGTDYSAHFERELQRIVRLGARENEGPRVLVVTAAGNNSSNNDVQGFFPCGFVVSNLICVAASDRLDYRAHFSNYGPRTVHLFAPGLQIHGNAAGALQQSHGAFVSSSGTSQAAPHVAGVALLVHGANPNLDAAGIKSVILSSVDVLPGGHEEVLSGGRLNAYRSVLVATGQDPALADRSFESRPGFGSGGGCQLQMMSDRSNSALVLLFLSFFILGLVYRRKKAAL